MIRKRITRNEHKMISHLKNTDIIPEISKLEYSYVTMEKYPMTLGEYIESNDIKSLDEILTFKNLIDEQIEKLHSIGIFHGDLHTSNIVLNPETNDVRIIDFGESRFIDDLNADDIDYFNEFLDPTNKFENIYDMLEYETTNWIHDYFD